LEFKIFAKTEAEAEFRFRLPLSGPQQQWPPVACSLFNVVEMATIISWVIHSIKGVFTDL